MNKNKRNHGMFAALLALNVSTAWAQSDAHSGHTPPAVVEEPMNRDEMKGMDHGAMPGMDHGAMPATPKESDAMPGMDHGGHGTMQQPAAAPGLRDPHAYAGGYDFSQFPMRHEGGEIKFGTLRVDRLEAVRVDGDSFAVYDLQAAYGGAFDRATVKAEGDIDSGELEDASTELLWSHAIAAFWNAQLGVRYDTGEGPDRSWLGLGIQGLAPYWFEVDVTAYVGDEGRSALNVEAEYELLLTQRLILQPRMEASLYGEDDAERGLGSGLSDVAAGLRLRYEIRREFAPYVGLEWGGKFGDTADAARAAGADTKETRAVAGVRFWF